MNENVNFNCQYQLAQLKNFKPSINYIDINFWPKPVKVNLSIKSGIRIYYNVIFDTIYRKFINDQIIKNGIVFALVRKNENDTIFVTPCLCVTIYDDEEMIRLSLNACEFDGNKSIIDKVTCAYKRNYGFENISDYKPLCHVKELPAATFQEDAKNFNPAIRTDLYKKCKNIAFGISNKVYKKESNMDGLPVITRVIINNPGVVVFWSDGTKTVSKCMSKDTFDPEVGLSMAISKKYYELLGFPNPRSAFKSQLKNADDQSQKTADKKAKKAKKD